MLGSRAQLELDLTSQRKCRTKVEPGCKLIKCIHNSLYDGAFANFHEKAMNYMVLAGLSMNKGLEMYPVLPCCSTYLVFVLAFWTKSLGFFGFSRDLSKNAKL